MDQNLSLLFVAECLLSSELGWLSSGLDLVLKYPKFNSLVKLNIRSYLKRVMRLLAAPEHCFDLSPGELKYYLKQR